MSVAISPSSEFWAWKYHHPHESEDASAVWGAAWRAGGRAAIAQSSRLCELVPMLRAILETLEDGYVEAEVRASDRRPEPVWDDDEDDGCRVSW